MPSEPVRRFHFLREIGSGAFGAVYRARLVQGDGFSRLVAVKLLHARWSDNDEAARRLRDEARLLGRLRHRNIVEVLDLTRIDGRAAVVMELLDAADLRLVIGAATEIGVPIPTRVACEVCAAVASALDAACNRPPADGDRPLRVVHRDIKPSNVMLTREGVVKVLDFGVARADFQGREAETRELTFGSVDFMAPERLFHEPDGPEGDIYALGATLYEMLAGKRFGKARLRQAEQERLVEERFEDLLAGRSFSDRETENLLHDLLYDMLAFRAGDRPPAADVVGRLRSIARRCAEEEGLEMWAEVLVPTLLEMSEKATQGKPAGSLSERVLTEDSFSSRGPGSGALPREPTASEAPLPPRRAPVVQRPRAPPTLDVDSLPAALPGLPGPALDDGDEEAATVVRAVSFDESEPPAGPQPLLLLAGAAAAAFVVVGVGAVLLGAVGIAWWGWSGAAALGGMDEMTVSASQAEAEAPPPAVDPTPVEAPQDAAAAVATPPIEAPAVEPAEVQAASGPTFTSLLPGTTRVAVRCDGGSATGEAVVTLSTDVPGNCTVTALGAARERRVAVIQGAKAVAYTCFEGASADCAVASR